MVGLATFKLHEAYHFKRSVFSLFKSFESTRVESLKKKDEERKHVTQRRLELDSEFRSQAAEKLEQKMLKVTSNCEEKLKELQAKAEDQVSSCTLEQDRGH